MVKISLILYILLNSHRLRDLCYPHKSFIIVYSVVLLRNIGSVVRLMGRNISLHGRWRNMKTGCLVKANIMFSWSDSYEFLADTGLIIFSIRYELGSIY